jgi:hypothetical protein
MSRALSSEHLASAHTVNIERAYAYAPKYGVCSRVTQENHSSSTQSKSGQVVRPFSQTCAGGFRSFSLELTEKNPETEIELVLPPRKPLGPLPTHHVQTNQLDDKLARPGIQTSVSDASPADISQTQ